MNDSFQTRIHHRMLEKNTRLCIGLDPRIELMPPHYLLNAEQESGQTLEAVGQAIKQFHRDIIDHVAEYAVCLKPQSAFFEQYGVAGLKALQDAVQYAQARGLPVILDAKRGDIDSTATAYATATIGKTSIFGQELSVLGADSVTVNPFLGTETLLPFLQTARKYGAGIFVLLKTSNPGSGEIQDAVIHTAELNQQSSVSTLLASKLSGLIQTEDLDEYGYSPLGVVVGATYPEIAQTFRTKLLNSIFLVPGIGAQGGTVSDLTVFFDKQGLGAVVNSSRGVVSAAHPTDPDFFRAVTLAAKTTRDQINVAVSAYRQ